MYLSLIQNSSHSLPQYIAYALNTIDTKYDFISNGLITDFLTAFAELS